MYEHVARPLHLLILVLILILLGTCASSIYFINEEPGLPPGAAVTHTPVVSAPTLIPVSSLPPKLDTAQDRASESITEANWSQLQPGLERRLIEVYDDLNQHVESLHVWRLDQSYFRMDIAYDQTPKSLESWQRETNALMVVNGGFYSIDNERYFPDGLTIINGKSLGHFFNWFDGMLAITESRAELRWLEQRPYNSAEPLQAALQSFPILVQPGGGLGYGPEGESNASARRTVIGQDKEGRILMIIAPQGYFTLHQLSVYLTESDLNLDIAVNLDGGGSTGILVASPPEIIPPTRPLPFVILVYAR